MTNEIDLVDIHNHKTFYYYNEDNDNKIVMLPDGDYFIISSKLIQNTMLHKDPLQVYLNGILQINNISFYEIKDENTNMGIGIEFVESLRRGDIVFLEWVYKDDR